MSSKREDSIQAALNDYHSGKFASLRATAKAYNIPLSTLFNRNTGKTSRQLAHQKEQRLTPKEEEFLVQWIIEQDNQGFPPTHTRTREMAERILQIHDDHQPLGRKWLTHFLQRHPEISSCIGKKIDAKRIQGTQPELVGEFYNLYEQLRKKYGIVDEDIWNMDEHGMGLGI